jgi:hypothetical protein
MNTLKTMTAAAALMLVAGAANAQQSPAQELGCTGTPEQVTMCVNSHLLDWTKRVPPAQQIKVTSQAQAAGICEDKAMVARCYENLQVQTSDKCKPYDPHMFHSVADCEKTQTDIAAINNGTYIAEARPPAKPTVQPIRLHGFSTGVGVVPAIVCPSDDTVQFLFRVYVGTFGQARQRQIMPQIDRLVAPRFPTSADDIHPEAYGCVIANGPATITWTPGGIVPIVSGTLPDGRAFSGVTMQQMYDQLTSAGRTLTPETNTPSWTSR